MVAAPFFGSSPKAYYAHPALLGTWCQSLGSIGRVVSEKNGNRQTNKQTNTLKTEDHIAIGYTYVLNLMIVIGGLIIVLVIFYKIQKMC